LIILSINTTSKACSVALYSHGQLAASFSVYSEKVASAQLTPMIADLLQKTDTSPAALSAVAVAKGPGSYTGLRIGVSTAKGICTALDIPLLAINSLEAMAFDVAAFVPDHTLIAPMLDARRMEVYTAVYDKNLNEILPTQAKILENVPFAELLAQKHVYFMGDGASKCQPLLQNNNNAHFLTNIWPTAGAIAQLAAVKYEQQAFENLVTFEPYYLKEFIGNISQ
jgi:tRNA threonylcarbamoyladenosine biosynthesis protein TsaB